MLVDTHAHLDFPTSLSNGELRGASTDDIQGILDRAKEAGVAKIICVGTSVEASKKCVEIADPPSHKATEGQGNIPEIYATVGIHAQDGKEDVEKYGSINNCVEKLRKILRSTQDDRDEGLQNDPPSLFELRRASSKVVVGVGECGFDFKVTSDTKPTAAGALAGKQVTGDKEKEFQKKLFVAQIELAVDLNLPLVIHCRNAWEETFELLDSIGKQVSFQNDKRRGLRGVFHSWTGDWMAAKRALDLGFYISFSGIVTFGNAPKVQEVASKIPLERMLLETDSPFLSPEPYRGLTNEPKNVKIVGEFIAKLRNLPLDQLAQVTSDNAGSLFGI